VATPANWQQGQEVVILPSVSDEELKQKFPKGHTMIKPYLRLTPQPNL
ncbi:MAG: peroxidase, partial [Bacteroidia bacterium]